MVILESGWRTPFNYNQYLELGIFKSHYLKYYKCRLFLTNSCREEIDITEIRNGSDSFEM